ncbi:hypothetical protein CALVIDRAFT_98826 [Calocera viscosa TUFC12733]|uniref:Uncharacterized protein n=1 Tax=Calocera viscosa (strain TUFC12733) TaxID=1330018 RepID=A0A167MJM5_CALVF|nr:hypothetical protein CALVIDRAFT_98826 [Calocera viscosa TUFC12733]
MLECSLAFFPLRSRAATCRLPPTAGMECDAMLSLSSPGQSDQGLFGGRAGSTISLGGDAPSFQFSVPCRCQAQPVGESAAYFGATRQFLPAFPVPRVKASCLRIVAHSGLLAKQLEYSPLRIRLTHDLESALTQ